MKKLPVGSNGLEMSQLVYGAWRLADDTDTSKAHIQAKIEACLDIGMTTFDHADIYGDYSCEALFGDVFKDMTDAHAITQHVSKCDVALLSDKFPNRQVKHYDTTSAYVTQSVETSLKRLNIDALDLLLIHRPDPLMDADDTGAALDALVDAGKVKNVGVSNFKPWDFELLQSRMKHPLVANQIEISLLANDAFINGDLAMAQQKRIAPMAWSPLAGGALFGDSPAAQRVMPKLEALAAEQGVDATAVALAWLLRHPANILPVIGTNNIQRIRASADALKVQLSREDWYLLYELANGHEVP